MYNNRVPLQNYQKTNAESLLKLSQKLFSDQIFDLYLTPFQLILLEYLLSIENDSNRLMTWKEFLNGNISLNVKMFSNIPMTNNNINNNDNINDNSHNNLFNDQNYNLLNNNLKSNEKQTPKSLNDRESSLSVDNTNPNEDDMSRVDLENFRQQINGHQFIGNLSLKVRYVLWQCVIDVNYANNEDFMGNIDEPSLLDYVLLDTELEDNAKNESESQEMPFLITKTNENTETPKPNDDYDDEEDNYDDEDEEDTTKKEVTINQPDPVNNQSSITPGECKYDDQHKLIIDFSISRNTLQNLRNSDSSKIMENSNKIYHSFEHDRETMLKRLKLVENDKLLETSKKRRRSNSGSEENNSDDDEHNMDDNLKDQEKPATKVQSNKSQKNNVGHSGSKVNKSDNSKEEDRPHENKRPRKNSTHVPNVSLGAANLSLSHLLSEIHENKPKLKMSDYELRHLIIDVRKNRSKWASDEKVGQEELYEACEKVVLELRNYTEHSTPFLNKVSKREAPNYHQVIKKSMDLNTVLKKLKTFQYTRKLEFVDDIMLIWKNCLTYNSDPSHYLRAHAFAMQKKSLQLIPLIPDIVIRNRAEVEKEIESMENDKDYKEEDEVAGSGRKGLNMGAHKPANASESTESNINNTETQEKNGVAEDEEPESKETDANLGNDVRDQNSLDKEPITTNSTTIDTTITDGDTITNTTSDAIDVTSNIITAPSQNQDNDLTQENENLENKKESSNVNRVAENEENEEIQMEEDAEEEDIDDELEETAHFMERDDDKDDVELSIWKTLTAPVRARLCMDRSSYFKDGKLNKDAKALLKNPDKMKNFDQLLIEYKEQKEQERENKIQEKELVMKNGFGTIIKQEFETQLQVVADSEIDSEAILDKEPPELDMDDMTFFTQYEINNTIPPLKYDGVETTSVDKDEDELVKHMLQEDNSTTIKFGGNDDSGLTPQMNKNITLIQQIRHICHKISLIRLLQSPQSMHSSKTNAQRSAFLESHQFKPTNFETIFELDPVSALPTRDMKYSKVLMKNMMYKNVSKIAMANGFESTQPSAISILSDMSEIYLSNLIKTIKVHQESVSLNQKSTSDILKLSLLENGIFRPDELYTYIETEFTKKTKRLSDVKVKLENFLRELLRPTLKSLSEQNFEDESQSFMTGDFATEITGEDFFGFKELGLEKEFGVLSSAVPLQMLTFRLQSNTVDSADQTKKIQPEEYHNIVYRKIIKEDIDSKRYSSILTPLLEKAMARSEAYLIKIKKSQTLPESEEDKYPEGTILEDDEILIKGKSNNRPKIPPTGKISTNYKKKLIADAFFLPEEEAKEIKTEVSSNQNDSQPEKSDQNIPKDENHEDSFLQDPLDTPTGVNTDFLFGQTTSPATSSFSLSLPRLDQ
ncbi:hypothetical protein TBLA_0I02120 [Henningerozyma blattae CBS 6284]|uniref:SAGA complex subunit Spt7 n=1 Tax=Henningerozyma blattae (strain ATCC 34711 / CBS 6284 / DSM 70876 / NBRC 10599 / NRRL Y-10934 / UCD 77-7) TaxID=1071380 RepID=I2H918_HENB6|nr:hypothetical protein TBLA_0I02120 [Tetrapisispora blattae CBS 6284]CCH62870.1 hypothetical protein TBLA_0I02120 [Tetrapisispora blattae CBS 6284]